MIPRVMTSSGNMIIARLGLVLTIRIRLPIISNGALVPIRRDTCTRRCTALVSLLSLTISWPVFNASMLAKEKVWIFRKRVSRRSRATPSPT